MIATTTVALPPPHLTIIDLALVSMIPRRPPRRTEATDMRQPDAVLVLLLLPRIPTLRAVTVIVPLSPI